MLDLQIIIGELNRLMEVATNYSQCMSPSAELDGVYINRNEVTWLSDYHLVSAEGWI